MEHYQKYFLKLLLNGEYIQWLHDYMEIHKEIDNTFYIRNKGLDATDALNCQFLNKMFFELKKSYCEKYGFGFDKNVICLKYNGKFYLFKYDGKCFSCVKWPYVDFDVVDYEEIVQRYDIFVKANVNDIQLAPLDVLIDRILDKPSEFYQKISESLTPEERVFILKNLKNKSCENCANMSCNVEHHEKIGLDESGRPQGENCVGWINHEIIGKSKVLKLTNIYDIKSR